MENNALDGGLNISLRPADNEVYIEIQCKRSRVTFVRIKMSPSDFTRALAGQYMVPVDMQTKGLDKVGKLMQVSEFTLNLPDWFNHMEFHKEREGVVERLKAHIDSLLPDGWVADGFFGRKGAFFTDNEGNEMVKVTARKWV